MRIKAVLLSLLFANAVASQDSSFTAKEAIDLALKQNLDIQIASTDLDIAKVNNNWGNAGGLPTATGNIFNTEAISNINQKLANGSNIERNNVSNSSINANLAISWRVFNGMRVRSTMERFDAMEKMGTIAVAQQIDQVIFDVLNIYYNLIRLNKQVIATKAIIDLSKERLKIAETRFNVGNGAKTDMLQAKIDLNAQEVNLQNIYKQVSNTKASMNTLLKKDAGASFHPKEEQFSIPSIEYNALVSKIDQQNPQLLLAQQEKLNLMIEKKNHQFTEDAFSEPEFKYGVEQVKINCRILSDQPNLWPQYRTGYRHPDIQWQYQQDPAESEQHSTEKAGFANRTAACIVAAGFADCVSGIPKCRFRIHG